MRALVTGGGGYLGTAIVRQLRARGDEVLVLGRNAYPHVEALGAVCVQADLERDTPDLAAKMAGCDVVFHAAALPPRWSPYASFVRTNVDGTRRMLEAARAAGVRRFVYTSTPSVAFSGTAQEGVTEEQAPYPPSYLSPYAQTKAEAERMVLGANHPDLSVVALRPRLIYGEAEPHMLPRLIERHRQGRLRIVGDGTAKNSLTYVENAAAAHLQAADALAPGAPCSGRAFFVADPEPVVLWAWLNGIFEGIGLPPLRRHISQRFAETAGAVAEAAWSVLPLRGEPPMTRFIARNLATPCWYDLRNARAAFGLNAVVSPEEALARTIADLRG